MRLIFRQLIAFGLLVGLAGGCGQTDEDERALVTDAEIAALRQDLIPPETAPDQAVTGRSFYVRLAWGKLAGDLDATQPTAWDGSLTVDVGTLQLTRLDYFDRGEHPEATGEPDRIAWTSQTQPHFDGLVARVEVPSDDATLTLDTPLFKRSFRASELTGGDEASFEVDPQGDAVSVSSIPASRCPGGFVLGYLKPAKLGHWTAFGGRTTDRTGAFNGTLRFRGLEEGTLHGAMVDEAGKQVAQVRGTLVREGTGGGSFSGELVDESGRALGSLTGIYTEPSYASRGSFQGTYEQICDE